MPAKRTKKWIAAALLVLCCAACAVGPDYVKPAVETPPRYKETHFPEVQGWKVAQPADLALPQKWWELFADPQLSALVEQVAVSNETIKAAQARFVQAQALVRQARSGYFPQATVGPSVTRSRAGGGSSSQRGASAETFNTYSLPLDVSWEADIWGRIRRSVESSRENAQASAADVAAARLSAQAELAQDYFLLRMQDAQKEVVDATVQSYRKALELTTNRYQAGVAAKADVLQAETQLKSTQAQSIDLEVQRAQLEHAIALLIGKPASAFTLPPVKLAPRFPQIPVELPAALLERRPDVAAAERRMAAANAQIGVARAAYFPALRISASAGFQALSFADWLLWPSRFWSIGTSLSQTLFDGGLRRGQNEEAVAVYQENVATYRQTVLTAFQEVEDNLAALRILEQESVVQEEAVRASRQSLEVALNQYRAGTINFLGVVVIQAIELTNEREALSVLARRYSASVLLIKALGGGWHADPLPPQS